MSAADVKIRRVIVNPPGLDLLGEAVFIHNGGAEDVDITGWKLVDFLLHEEHRATFTFPTFTLLSGATVAVHSGSGANDGQNLFWDRIDPVWNNGGDRATLFNAAGALVTSVTWDGPPHEGRVVDTTEIAAELAEAGLGQPTGPVHWTTKGPVGGEIFWQEFGPDLTAFHIGFPESIPPGAVVPEDRIIGVRQSILRTYLDLGGPQGLGRPLTRRREVPVREAGRQAIRQDFEGGVIFRSAETRAHLVKGAILQKYLGEEVGGSAGAMGLPISDEILEGSGLRYSEFERGSIWFTHEDGTRAIFALQVEFVGFHCFGKQQGVGDDEPYLAVDVTPLDRSLDITEPDLDAKWITKLPTSGPPAYENVESGTTLPDTVPIFIGRAAPLLIKVNLWENDEGDPNALRRELQTAVAATGDVVAAFVPAASAVAKSPAVQAHLTDILNGFAATGDDFIGRGELKLDSRRAILSRLRTTTEPEFGLVAHDRVFLTDKDASYNAYFFVRQLGPVLEP
jgi:lamin tail-like protein/LGFP repeat-containing protein